ncbi:MAG: inositol monophosphatase [Rhizobiaceae bacterium]|nr:inositol monophosphatase [Rhizobiaceae bacterium]MBL4732630.1 inositol monophosphatase [Rhizobiaceae bacterium]
MARSALLQIMTTTAFRAGRSLSRDFGEIQSLQASVKSSKEFADAAARSSTKIIREQLVKARPDFGMMIDGAVEQVGKDRNHRWIVNPLNGNINFAHSQPYFGISIALEHEGQIVAGVIYSPVLDDLYAAEKGTGAFHNDRRLRTANRSHLSDSLLGMGNSSKSSTSKTQFLKNQAMLSGEVADIRIFGCTCLSLAAIAGGNLDASFETGINYSGVAAGIVIVREAGGYVTNASGDKSLIDQSTVVAGNSAIHQRLLKILP